MPARLVGRIPLSVTDLSRMKTSYIFAAILACSAAGALLGHRAAKNLMLLASGALSLYGLAPMLG